MMGVYMTAFSQPAGRPSAQATASQGLVHLWRHTFEHLYVPLAYSIYAALAAAAQGGAHLDASIVQSISLSPAPFHLAGVALHALHAALCFSLIRRLTGRQPVAWICALLFALRQMPLESVGRISELSGLSRGAILLL